MAEVKTTLIEEINKIDDESIIEQLTELLFESDQALVIEFDTSQIVQIEESRKQIERGEVFHMRK